MPGLSLGEAVLAGQEQLGGWMPIASVPRQKYPHFTVRHVRGTARQNLVLDQNRQKNGEFAVTPGARPPRTPSRQPWIRKV